MQTFTRAKGAPLTPSEPGRWLRGAVAALAWLWLFLPTVWMWPTARSLGDITLSALLWSACLLWRPLTRVASCLLVLIGACYLGYFYAVHSAPDEFFWYSVLGASSTEALEYASSYRLQDLASLLTWLLPAIAAAIHLWRRAPLLGGGWRALGWITLLVWVGLVAMSISKGYGVEGTLRRVERVYPMTLGESFTRFSNASEAIYRIPVVVAPPAPPKADVVVVVIGESASAQRWSLLGYQGNDTNAPLNRWRDGLVALPVTANGNNTGKTVPVLLTGHKMEQMPEAGVATYLDEARAAGFRVETLSNQSASGMSLSFAHAAFRQRSDQFVNLQDGLQDGALTQPLQASLQEQAAQGKPLLVTLHMYGSHPRVAKRYPVEFARWDDPYDNSIAYSSALLADWIAELDALKDVRTALVFISDHGQNFPQCGGSYTHGSARSAYEVPLLVWGNAALRAQQPQWWAQLQRVAAGAVAPDGLLRQNNLLFTEVVENLLGYPGGVPSLGGHTAADFRKPVQGGHYPPTDAENPCADWFSQVARSHPAATP